MIRLHRGSTLKYALPALPRRGAGPISLPVRRRPRHVETPSGESPTGEQQRSVAAPSWNAIGLTRIAYSDPGLLFDSGIRTARSAWLIGTRATVGRVQPRLFPVRLPAIKGSSGTLIGPAGSRDGVGAVVCRERFAIRCSCRMVTVCTDVPRARLSPDHSGIGTQKRGSRRPHCPLDSR
jgi:hypothetical protein